MCMVVGLRVYSRCSASFVPVYLVAFVLVRRPSSETFTFVGNSYSKGRLCRTDSKAHLEQVSSGCHHGKSTEAIISAKILATGRAIIQV